MGVESLHSRRRWFVPLVWLRGSVENLVSAGRDHERDRVLWIGKSVREWCFSEVGAMLTRCGGHRGRERRLSDARVSDASCHDVSQLGVQCGGDDRGKGPSSIILPPQMGH